MKICKQSYWKTMSMFRNNATNAISYSIPSWCLLLHPISELKLNHVPFWNWKFKTHSVLIKYCSLINKRYIFLWNYDFFKNYIIYFIIKMEHISTTQKPRFLSRLLRLVTCGIPITTYNLISTNRLTLFVDIDWSVHWVWSSH